MQSILTRPRLGRAGIVQLPVNEIDPNPNQPRKLFDDSQLAELSASIAEYGVISPLTVRLHFGRYELVAGERRLRAARMAGLKKVPCIVLDVNMEESSMLAMVENLQRQDLDFLEEARGIANLMRMYGLSQEECARRLGRSQSSVANKLRLLKLPDEVQLALKEGLISMGHAKAIAGAPQELQLRTLKKILKKSLSVRQAEELVRTLTEQPAEAAQNMEDEEYPESYSRLVEQLEKFFSQDISIKRSKNGGGRIVIGFDDDKDIEQFIERFSGRLK